MIKTALLWLCILATVSCRKYDGIAVHETLAPADVNLPLTYMEVYASVTPENPNNPFDSAGIWHNEILGYIHEQSGYVTPLREHSISNLVATFALERWDHADMRIAVPIPQWQEADGLLQLQNEIVGNSDLSDSGKQQLQRLLAAVWEHSMEDRFSYPALKHSIMELEHMWLHNASLPVKDTNLLQIAASIARHSAYYWSVDGTALPLESLPAYNGAPQPAEKIAFKNIVRFIATVQWDTAGFISGYAGGSLKEAAGKAAGANGWIHRFFDYGVPDGW